MVRWSSGRWISGGAAQRGCWILDPVWRNASSGVEASSGAVGLAEEELVLDERVRAPTVKGKREGDFSSERRVGVGWTAHQRGTRNSSDAHRARTVIQLAASRRRESVVVCVGFPCRFEDSACRQAATRVSVFSNIRVETFCASRARARAKSTGSNRRARLGMKLTRSPRSKIEQARRTR